MKKSSSLINTITMHFCVSQSFIHLLFRSVLLIQGTGPHFLLFYDRVVEPGKLLSPGKHCFVRNKERAEGEPKRERKFYF